MPIKEEKLKTAEDVRQITFNAIDRQITDLKVELEEIAIQGKAFQHVWIYNPENMDVPILSIQKYLSNLGYLVRLNGNKVIISWD